MQNITYSEAEMAPTGRSQQLGSGSGGGTLDGMSWQLGSSSGGEASDGRGWRSGDSGHGDLVW